MKIYILNFLVYTMAMVGVIYVSLMIFKRTMTQNNQNSSNNSLKIESSLNIGPRKTLHVIKVDGERFLIASDIQNTTFLSKLNENKNIKPQKKMFMDELNELKKYDKKESISVIDGINKEEKSVFRELIQKL
ncbi:MAG: hypothetical protein BHW07_01675 [Clostridium sp. CAG_433_25_7]|nr:MAG: hypothetical protein BHW07_01675 [Clostridium sp. CAG_433_25_7]